MNRADRPAPGRSIPLRTRLEQKIIKPEDPNGCWIWIGAKRRNGYGKIMTEKSRTYAAHRASYEVYIGEIPDGYFVCHKCDTPSCVNPDHLFVGTPNDNVQDMLSKGRQATGDQKALSGTENGRTKLTEDEVRDIRRLYDLGEMTLSEIADKYSITFGNVWKIGTRFSWQHLPETKELEK